MRALPSAGRTACVTAQASYPAAARRGRYAPCNPAVTLMSQSTPEPVSTPAALPTRPAVTERSIEVRGRRAQVFRGGRGPSLLLIHGGWGGAAAHWEPVFAPLAEGYDVIAPDLPGFVDGDATDLRSVDDYADWLVALLDVLGVQRAACVGNSFGASVAWSLACRHPERCGALVLVNGFPMPRTPRLLRALGALGPARALLGQFLRFSAFSPRALAQAFVDPANIPASLHRLSAAAHPEPAERMVDAFIRGGTALDPPKARTLLLWGAADRLRQSRAASSSRAPRARAPRRASAPR